MAAGAYPAGGSTEPDGTVTTEMPSLGATSAAGEPSSTSVESGSADSFAERPEVFVGAAFAGGLLLAQILRRVRR
jgi:hypothetical protein